MCTADNCHFTFTAVTSASGLSRAHQLMSLVRPHFEPLGAGGFAKRRAQVPATWDKALPETKTLGDSIFEFLFLLPLVRPGQAGGHDTNAPR